MVPCNQKPVCYQWAKLTPFKRFFLTTVEVAYGPGPAHILWNMFWVFCLPSVPLHGNLFENIYSHKVNRHLISWTSVLLLHFFMYYNTIKISHFGWAWITEKPFYCKNSYEITEAFISFTCWQVSTEILWKKLFLAGLKFLKFLYFKPTNWLPPPNLKNKLSCQPQRV